MKGYPKWGNSSNEGMAKVKIQFLSRESPFRLTPTFEPLGLTWLYIMMRLITEGFYELDKWRKGKERVQTRQIQHQIASGKPTGFSKLKKNSVVRGLFRGIEEVKEDNIEDSDDSVEIDMCGFLTYDTFQEAFDTYEPSPSL